MNHFTPRCWHNVSGVFSELKLKCSKMSWVPGSPICFRCGNLYSPQSGCFFFFFNLNTGSICSSRSLLLLPLSTWLSDADAAPENMYLFVLWFSLPLVSEAPGLMLLDQSLSFLNLLYRQIRAIASNIRWQNSLKTPEEPFQSRAVLFGWHLLMSCHSCFPSMTRTWNMPHAW